VIVDSLKIQLHMLGNKIIRIECRSIQEAQQHQSLVIVNPSPEQVHWKLKKEPNAVILATSSLQVKVDLSSGKIQFLDSSGNTLLRENGRDIVRAIVLGDRTNSIRQKFILSSDEALYGLGQHQEGNLNLRNKTVDLFQVNMKVSVPMLVSSKGYGILWDNYSLSKFTDNSEGMEIWSEVADGIDYYFIAGQNPDEVISGYRMLTGQAPLYPKWHMAFFNLRNDIKRRMRFSELSMNSGSGKFLWMLLFRTGILESTEMGLTFYGPDSLSRSDENDQ